jgi:hypothetical protein
MLVSQGIELLTKFWASGRLLRGFSSVFPNSNSLNRRIRSAKRSAFQRALRDGPPTRFRRLEARRVLNASFEFVGTDLQLFDFADGTDINVTFDGVTHEFTLSSGNWFDGGFDTGSNSLLAVLTGELSIDAAFATDVALSGSLVFLDSVSINTGGALTGDGVATDLDIGNQWLVSAQSIQLDGIGYQATSDILLQATSGDITLDASVTSSSGAITVQATGNVFQNADLEIMVVADAVDQSIYVHSSAGSIIMADGTETRTIDGNIRYEAEQDLVISSIDAGDAGIALLAGQDIIDGQNDTVTESIDGFAVPGGVPRLVNVSGGELVLQAGGSIGSLGNPFDSSVNSVSALAGTDLYLFESTALEIADLNVAVTQINPDGSTALLDATLAGVTSTGGHAKVETIAGTLTVAQPVSADQDILLAAGGAGSDLVINAAVTSSSGAISLLGQRDVFQGVGGNVLVSVGSDASGNSVYARAVTGSIEMSGTSTTTTQGGNIYYQASTANEDVTVGQLNAGSGVVAITAGGDIVDGQADTVGVDGNGFATVIGARTVNVIGSEARLEAGGAIGQAGNPLDLSVATLGSSSGGDSYLLESTAMTIGLIAPLQVTRVHLSSTTAPVNVGGLAGVTSTGGHAKVETIAGTLTVAQPVSADQDILLAAGGAGSDLVINAAVTSSNGAISLLGQRDVFQGVGGNVLVSVGSDASGNSVYARAVTGSIEMSGTSTTTTQGGNIYYQASTANEDVTVGQLNAGSGVVAITAGGDIVDGQADTVGVDGNGFATVIGARTVNVIGSGARLEAGGAIGQAGNPLDLSVATLGSSSGGDSYLLESTAMTIGLIAPLQVTRVHLSSTTAPVNVGGLAGVTSTGGHAKVETIAGTLTVAQPVSADQDILLAAGGAGSDLVINAAVTSSNGAISLLGQRDVFQGVGGNVLVSVGSDASGNSVYARAVTGSIEMSGTSTTTTQGGNIYYQASTANEDVTVGQLNAGSGVVAITAGGDIVDGQADTVGVDGNGFATVIGARTVNVIGSGARLEAGGAIGQAGNPLDLSVATLGSSSGGDSYLLESTAMTIGLIAPLQVTRVHLSSTTAPVNVGGLAGVTSTGGHAKVETIAGTLTVAQPVSADQDILLAAGGAGSDLVINAAVTSSNGAISLLGQRDVFQGVGGNVLVSVGSDASGNSVYARAVTGSIEMSGTSTTTTQGGNIYYQASTANEDVTVGQLNAGSGVVAITAGGDIVDGQADTVGVDGNGFATVIGARTVNVIGSGARLEAGGAIGQAGNPLDLSVATLGSSSGGDSYLLESTAMTIGLIAPLQVTRVHLSSTTAPVNVGGLAGVTSTGGHAKVETIAGTLTVAQPVSADQDILLAAGGAGSDLVINAAVTTQVGALMLLANSDVFQNADLQVAVGSDPVDHSIYVRAVNGTVSVAPGFAALTAGGNIRYEAGLDLVVDQINAGAGQVALVSGGSILDAQNDTVSPDANGFSLLTGDPRVLNVIATSIYLEAGGSIGQAVNPLDIQADFLQATGVDGVYVLESDSLIVQAVDVRVTRVHLDSTTQIISPVALGNASLSGPFKIETLAGDLQVDGAISSAGNVLLAAGGPGSSVILNQEVVSSLGAITIQATANILQNANLSITLGTDPLNHSVYLRALSGSILMNGTAETTTAGGNVIAEAFADVVLGIIDAQSGEISVTAGGDILDGQNDTIVRDPSTGFAILGGDSRVENLTAAAVRLVAGGSIGALGNPIDIEATDLAAHADGSISLLESTSLNITSIGPIEAYRVQLDSTVSLQTAAALEGIRSANGQVAVDTLGGSLTVVDGTVADTVTGVEFAVSSSGDLLLAAGGAGSDLVLDASVVSRFGDGWLAANSSIYSLPQIAGSDVTAIVRGDHLTLYAGNQIFLPNMEVQSMEARITNASNFMVDPVFLNAVANEAGTLVLDELVHEVATSQGVNTTPNNEINPQFPGSDLDSWSDQFEFINRFSDGFSLFVRNAGQLTLAAQNFLNSLEVTGDSPGVYVETLSGLAASDLIVTGESRITSTNPTRDPGVVLIAHDQLQIGPGATLDLIIDMTDPMVTDPVQTLNTLDLNAFAYDGGDPGIADVPVSTRFVVRSGFFEDFQSHLDQRVRMEFGSAGESGFMTLIHFADNAFQVYDQLGHVSQLEAGSLFQLQDLVANSNPIQNSGAEDALFARDPGSRFSDQFLLNNPVLPTEVIIRRSLDFFLFSNGGAADAQSVVDHASYFQEVLNVSTLGEEPPVGFEVIVPEPLIPPAPVFAQPSPFVEPPAPLLIAEAELPILQPKTVEVAFYQIEFDDENEDGQVDADEMPSFEEALDPDRILRETKVTIEPKNAGEAPSQGEIEDEKSKFLNRPDQPSGAYAIIRSGIGGQEEVLDVFAIRDWPEDASESADSQVPDEIPQLPPLTTPSESSGEAAERAADELPQPGDFVPPPPIVPDPEEGAANLPGGSNWRDRFAGSGLLMSTLWMLRAAERRPARLTPSETSGEASCSPGMEGIGEAQGFSQETYTSSARRARRWKRGLAR